jgi:excisionase family DNA binding protein
MQASNGQRAGGADGSAPLMSIRDLAEFLGVSQRTAWGLIAKGEVQRVRIGRAVRVTRESAEAFVARGGTAR